MIPQKRAQGFSPLIKIILVLLCILVMGILIVAVANIGAADVNQTTSGNKDKLDECLTGSALCSDVILDNQKSDTTTNSEETS